MTDKEPNVWPGVSDAAEAGLTRAGMPTLRSGGGVSPEPGSSERPHASGVLNIVSTILLMLSVFGLAFIPLRGSQDEWWHLKTGQWIWEHRGLPVNDIFTYTGENLRWYNHEWMSQVIFYGIYRIGEMTGLGGGGESSGLLWLIGFKALVVTATFLLVARLALQRLARSPAAWSAACVIAVIGADISRRTIHPRPPIFSYLLFAIFLLILYGWKRGRLRCGWLWALVPLTVLWANLHGMVLLAVVAVGAFAAGELLENGGRWLGSQFERGPEAGGFFAQVFTRRAAQLCALTATVGVACMAQPSGYHIFFLGRNFTADPLLQKIILEMMPSPSPFMRIHPELPWWDLQGWIARPAGFWTFWVALVVTVVLFFRNRCRLPYAADYLLLGFFTFQAVMHWRLLPLFAVAAAAPVASLVAARLRRDRPMGETLLPPSRWPQPVFALALAGLVGWFNFAVAEPPPQTFFRRNLQLLRGHAASLADYPAPLMDYLEQSGLPPRMFIDSNYCGYAMWRLSPEKYKLFTDNRFDLFGSDYVWQERAIFFALHKGDRLDGRTVTEDWDQALRRYNVNLLVFRPIDRQDLYKALKRSAEWRLVYYYIAPEAAPRNWPVEGYYVWLREGPDAAPLAQKAEEFFRRQTPNAPPPAELWATLRER